MSADTKSVSAEYLVLPLKAIGPGGRPRLNFLGWYRRYPNYPFDVMDWDWIGDSGLGVRHYYDYNIRDAAVRPVELGRPIVRWWRRPPGGGVWELVGDAGPGVRHFKSLVDTDA